MSILNDIKQNLGIVSDYTEFDTVLLMHLNSTLASLKQIGVQPLSGDDLYITSATDWSDVYTSGSVLELIKVYTYARVRLMFDTATMSGTTKQALDNLVDEMGWRINVECG